MYALANTKVSILRGSGEDIYGDETDATTAVATGIPASLSETAQNVFDPSTGTRRVVRAYRARLPRGTDVDPSDRIKDDTTNDIYTINDVIRQTQPGFQGDLRLELERTTQ